jgi:hypothetical protein
MRSAGFRLLLVGLLVPAGCTSLGARLKGSPAATAKNSGKAGDFFTAWNANAERIESLRCDDVDLDGRSQGQPYQLGAYLAYQKDEKFRLLGKFAGKSEVDLGSNEQEIWFWIARAEPPAVYFCKREDLGRVKLAMPFKPDWLVEAMGVSPLVPEDFQEGPATPETLVYTATQRNPAGERVLKRIVVNRQTNRVDAFELLDLNQKLLARAQIVEYYDDPATGLFVPRKINLVWPDADTRLTMTMSKRYVELNRITPDVAGRLFRRGTYSNTQEVDLGRGGGSQVARGDAPQGRSLRYDPPAEGAGKVNGNRPGYFDEGVRPARGAAELKGTIEPASRRPMGPPSFGPDR